MAQFPTTFVQTQNFPFLQYFFSTKHSDAYL